MGKQELRDEIMQAALKLVTEKGYFNTSIADICKQADVSTGTIYHYFKTKESIVDALFQDVLQNLSDSIEEIRTKTDHTFERLRAIAELFFALTEEAPEVMRFMVCVRHQEFLCDRPPLSLAKPFQQLTWIMQEGIKAGELRRMDPAVASACFYGAIVQMVQMRLDGALERPLNWYLLDTWTAIWRMLSP
ncbi:MAG: TetR/AcrR family transcriptional regulator [Methylohalobius sp.]